MAPGANLDAGSFTQGPGGKIGMSIFQVSSSAPKLILDYLVIAAQITSGDTRMKTCESRSFTSFPTHDDGGDSRDATAGTHHG